MSRENAEKHLEKIFDISDAANKKLEDAIKTLKDFKELLEKAKNSTLDEDQGDEFSSKDKSSSSNEILSKDKSSSSTEILSKDKIDIPSVIEFYESNICVAREEVEKIEIFVEKIIEIIDLNDNALDAYDEKENAFVLMHSEQYPTHIDKLMYYNDEVREKNKKATELLGKTICAVNNAFDEVLILTSDKKHKFCNDDSSLTYNKIDNKTEKYY